MNNLTTKMSQTSQKFCPSVTFSFNEFLNLLCVFPAAFLLQLCLHIIAFTGSSRPGQKAVEAMPGI